MKVVVDNKIPFIQEAIEQIADTVIYKKGSEINASDVADADALIIRTRTRCNRSLLENSAVKYIATATIGFDHLDVAFLKEKNISWKNCPGCNANSVAQYIYSSLLLLENAGKISLNQCTFGIIGAGHVGRAVGKAVKKLGVRVLYNDPPLEEEAKEQGIQFASLQTIQEECDIISFHTPLVMDGKYPTYHLADETFMSQIKEGCIIINSSRGSVVDNEALLRMLENGHIKEAIIDTWENEPNINGKLLDKVFIGTPHIAGYSADGKANATRMALEGLCQYFGLPFHYTITPPELPTALRPLPQATPHEKALMLYNPLKDSSRLKTHPEQFEDLRGNYPLRREM